MKWSRSQDGRWSKQAKVGGHTAKARWSHARRGRRGATINVNEQAVHAKLFLRRENGLLAGKARSKRRRRRKKKRILFNAEWKLNGARLAMNPPTNLEKGEVTGSRVKLRGK